MVGRGPILLAIIDIFAAQGQQFLIIRPDFVSAKVGGESPKPILAISVSFALSCRSIAPTESTNRNTVAEISPVLGEARSSVAVNIYKISFYVKT